MAYFCPALNLKSERIDKMLSLLCFALIGRINPISNINSIKIVLILGFKKEGNRQRTTRKGGGV